MLNVNNNVNENARATVRFDDSQDFQDFAGLMTRSKTVPQVMTGSREIKKNFLKTKLGRTFRRHFSSS